MRRWIDTARLLGRAGSLPVTAALLVSTAFGLAPVAFMVGMAVLLSRVPAVARGEAAFGAAAALTLATLAAQQLLGPMQAALGELIARRVDGHCVQRALAAAYRDAPVAALERPGTLDLLADVRTAVDRASPSPGAAAAALPALAARYAGLAGAVVLVGVVLSPAVAAVVAATALVVRFGQRGSLGRFAAGWDALSPQRRRLSYVRELSTGTAAAKEIRVLGLLDYLGGRLHTEHHGYLDPLWALRRRLLRLPFVGFALAGLAGAAVALVAVAQATAAGGLDLLGYAVAVQAVLVPIRFGVYFPEADVQTQFGGRAYAALTGFEAAVRGERLPGTAPAPAPRREIRFTGVGFAYPEGRRVFTDLDLTIPAGRCTAIVGLNGAGKTTLVKLLTRCYDPDRGAITADGVDLRDFDPASWQQRLAVIFQDFNRYELSAADNIGLGTGDETAWRAVAARAGAGEVLAGLPGGLDTTLNARYPGGTDLSGGQWQRIALARALHAVERGARVLVLDEPTAALDVRAEVEFFDRFLTETEGLTSVIVSHRFSTVRRADQIVVLSDGLVVERGSHDELMAAQGHYAEMFALQASRFREAVG
ncbi:multidrug ABC transporter permease [Catellatospora sp. IY07-71]|uniref:ATP-binding cassette domain-containing protein n=1 Tax=Catellatospora sp. IY07-71 TaxID=2728827 RepID=UPI001BB3F7E5|nr:ATP-binding cassette domain-containing protein [Catellatospora sp. IY07-71]BCJ74744.1 multidrug ABC transporter permease [Catellatospora sp. IY07-71]